MDPIFPYKRRAISFAVLLHALKQVASYANVKRTIALAGEDVDKAGGHAISLWFWMGGSSPPMEEGIN